jgi:hypothetical protein
VDELQMTKHTIEVDEATAVALETRAAELGVTVSQLIAGLIGHENQPTATDPDSLSELDRRWEMVKSGDSTISNDEVVHWLATWGTPSFKPWNNR